MLLQFLYKRKKQQQKHQKTIYTPVAREFVQTWRIRGLKQSFRCLEFAARAAVSGHSQKAQCFTACHRFPRSLLLTAAVRRKTARGAGSSVTRVLQGDLPHTVTSKSSFHIIEYLARISVFPVCIQIYFIVSLIQ